MIDEFMIRQGEVLEAVAQTYLRIALLAIFMDIEYQSITYGAREHVEAT